MKELNAGFESSSSIIVAFKVLAKFFTLALSSSHMQGSLSQGVKQFSEFDSSSEFWYESDILLQRKQIGKKSEKNRPTASLKVLFFVMKIMQKSLELRGEG